MLRTLTLVAALTIAATPALVAGAVLVAPATTSAPSGNTAATSATTTTTAAASVATTGNGAPSGAHYNLNLIGVPKDKTADMTNNDGHRIFVQLTGGEDATSLKGKLFSEITRVNKIFLQPAPAGESFQVLDANATDANGALFQLPIDVSTKWTVWARALGKPGGKSLTTTCATVTVLDATGLPVQEVICSVATLTMQRTKNAKFMNVSSSLLFVTIAVDPAVDTRYHHDIDSFGTALQRVPPELLLELPELRAQAAPAPLLSGCWIAPRAADGSRIWGPVGAGTESP